MDLDGPWNKKGKPRLLTNKQVNNLSDELNAFSGDTIGVDNLTEAMRNLKREELEKSGVVPLQIYNFNPSRQSLQNYKALMMCNQKNILMI